MSWMIVLKQLLLLKFLLEMICYIRYEVISSKMILPALILLGCGTIHFTMCLIKNILSCTPRLQYVITQCCNSVFLYCIDFLYALMDVSTVRAPHLNYL